MRKVYSLLSIQLLVTVLMILVVNQSRAIARFQAHNMWLAYLNMFVTFGTSIALSIEID